MVVLDYYGFLKWSVFSMSLAMWYVFSFASMKVMKHDFLMRIISLSIMICIIILLFACLGLGKR